MLYWDFLELFFPFLAFSVCGWLTPWTESADMKGCMHVKKPAFISKPSSRCHPALGWPFQEKKKQKLLPPVGPHCFLISEEAGAFSQSVVSKALDSCSASPFLFEHLPASSYPPGKGSLPALSWPSATTSFYIYANSRSLPPFLSLFLSSSSFVPLITTLFIISGIVCVSIFCHLYKGYQLSEIVGLMIKSFFFPIH